MRSARLPAALSAGGVPRTHAAAALRGHVGRGTRAGVMPACSLLPLTTPQHPCATHAALARGAPQARAAGGGGPSRLSGAVAGVKRAQQTPRVQDQKGRGALRSARTHARGFRAAAACVPSGARVEQTAAWRSGPGMKSCFVPLYVHNQLDPRHRAATPRSLKVSQTRRSWPQPPLCARSPRGL